MTSQATILQLQDAVKVSTQCFMNMWQGVILVCMHAAIDTWFWNYEFVFIYSAYTMRMLQPIWIDDTQNTQK